MGYHWKSSSNTLFSLPKSQHFVLDFGGHWLLIRARWPSVGVGKREMRAPGWRYYRSVTNRVPVGQSPRYQDSVYKGDASP